MVWVLGASTGRGDVGIYSQAGGGAVCLSVYTLPGSNPPPAGREGGRGDRLGDGDWLQIKAGHFQETFLCVSHGADKQDAREGGPVSVYQRLMNCFGCCGFLSAD